jgi:hypothetical protein
MKKILLSLLLLLQLTVTYAGPDRAVVTQFLDDLANLQVEELPSLLSFYYMENPEIFLDVTKCTSVSREHLVNYIFTLNEGEYGAHALGLTEITPSKLHFALSNYFWDKSYHRCAIERHSPYVLEETIFYQGVTSGYVIMFDIAWDD